MDIGGEDDDRIARRVTALTDLIQCRRSPSEARLLLRDFTWDSDPLVHVSNTDVSAVLQTFVSGTASFTFVEEWAEVLESREDVRIDPTAHAALYELANPALEGHLTVDRARELLAALRL